MRRLSLCFFSDRIENEYQKQNMDSNFVAFWRNLLIMGLFSFAIGLYGLLKYNLWEFALMCLIFDALLPIFYFVSRKGPTYFDFCCLAVSIAINTSAPVAILMHQNIGPFADYYSYLTGQAVANLNQSFNLGSRFNLKVISILYNLFLGSFTKIFVLKDLTIFTFLFIGCNFFVMNYMYWQDRNQRQAFLTKQNELLWQKKIGTSAKISIITCVSQKGQLLFDLTKCNSIMKKLFDISSQNTLQNFINSFKMTQKNHFSTRILTTMNSQQKSSKIQSLHNSINRFSEETQIDGSDFIGVYNGCVYDVKIFTTWNDTLLNIHTLMTKSLIETESESRSMIEYERQVFTNFRKNFAKQIKQIFVKLQMIRHHGQNLYNGSVINDVYDLLRLNYNLQLYLNPKYELTKINFCLKPLIEKITSIVRTAIPKPLKIDFECSIDPNLKMFSCQKTVFQIFFNLYSIIVKSANKSGSVCALVQQRSTQFGSIINIRIESNITSLQSILGGQNYKRNNYGKIFEHLLNDKKVCVDLLVSENMINKIGPIKYIQMMENYQKNPTLSFALYQDLSIMNFGQSIKMK